MYILNYEKYYNVPYPAPFEIDSMLIESLAAEKIDLAISYDGNYAYMVINSIGVYSIDVSDLSKPYIF